MAEEERQKKEEEKYPGGSPVLALGIYLLVGYMLLMTLLIFAALVVLWPPIGPEGKVAAQAALEGVTAPTPSPAPAAPTPSPTPDARGAVEFAQHEVGLPQHVARRHARRVVGEGAAEGGEGVAVLPGAEVRDGQLDEQLGGVGPEGGGRLEGRDGRGPVGPRRVDAAEYGVGRGEDGAVFGLGRGVTAGAAVRLGRLVALAEGVGRGLCGGREEEQREQQRVEVHETLGRAAESDKNVDGG